jgi:hypothetical protein
MAPPVSIIIAAIKKIIINSAAENLIFNGKKPIVFTKNG